MAFIFAVTISVVTAQDLTTEERVYLENIRSIKFHHEGLFTSLPIIDLNSGGRLILTFDDVYGGDRVYTYKILHCDKDWNISSIDEMEYLDGFNDEEIRDYFYSIGTKLDYTHYRLELPNRDVSWRLSGNYILVVTDDDAGEVAFTRRFMVTEPSLKITTEVRKPVLASRVGTHQELSMVIDYKNFRLMSPQREIFVTILQNGRWDNALRNIQPRFATGDILRFDQTDRLTFAGSKEFRGIDLRSLRSRGFGVHSIDTYTDGYDVLLELDKSRDGQVAFDYEDLNGDYIIESLEDRDDDLTAEYVDAYFALSSPFPLVEGDVCVVGKFTDWVCADDQVMRYDVKNQVYYTSIMMKQGYYDYQYAKVLDGQLDYEAFEGSHFSTRNEYTVLVYFRSFTERYDRLIGVQSIRSQF